MIRFILIVLFLGVFFVVSIPIYPVLLIIGLFSKKQRDKMSYAIVTWAFTFILLIAGTKIDVIGYDRVPKDKHPAFIYGSLLTTLTL